MPTVSELDVRDRICPLTWVAAKLALEDLPAGATLRVRCAPGEALANVPRSARLDGHAASVEDGAVVVIVKGAG